MKDILLLTDNQDLADDLKMQLERFIADLHFAGPAPDMIIIDENMQRYQQMRQRFPKVPILLLGGDASVAGDNLNICLSKPFLLRQLLDIVRAANNKLDYSAAGYLRFNNYELRPQSREIVDNDSGQVVKLTEREVGILKYLYKNAPQYVSKTQLQTSVWQYHEEVTTHTIETHIYRLRQKVEKVSGRRLILTDNGSYLLIKEA